MSLVIARIHNSKVYIFADTALTFNGGIRSNPFVEGCLKVYRLSPNLAVAFAGVREHFAAVASSMLLSDDADRIAREGLQCQANGLKIDLIVATAEPPRLLFVKEGTLAECSAGYIGDADAFEVFQKYYHSTEVSSPEFVVQERPTISFLRIPEPVESDEIYGRLYHAFKRIIWDERISGVGGVVVPLCTDAGRLRYMCYGDVVSDPLRPEDWGPEAKAIQFGTPQNGGYAVNFLDDISSGGTGSEVGYYFLQGGFGVIFPQDSLGVRNARIVRAANPALWALETRRELGHPLITAFLMHEHCMGSGEYLIANKQYEDAKFCYELRIESEDLKRNAALYDRYLAGYAAALFNSGDAAVARTIVERHTRLNADATRSKDVLRQINAIQRNIESH